MHKTEFVDSGYDRDFRRESGSHNREPKFIN